MRSVGHFASACLLAVLLAYSAANAQETNDADAPAVAAADDQEAREDTVSGALDDSSGSIEAVREQVDEAPGRIWRISGDMRAGFNRSEQENDDGSSETDSSWLGRFRLGAGANVNEWLVFNSRIATRCSSDECSPDFTLDPTIATRTSIDDGEITFDELYVHAFRLERFDIAIGRLQTKFVARAGVFAKSLDRNESNAFNVNWTDGVHATYHFADKSIFHLILEYNDSDGPSNVRRGPIDFTDDDSRVGYFLAWESLERWGPFTQRGLDLTYLPKSLFKDGTQAGPVDDYIGVVARFASSRPFREKGRRWNVAGEIGYAPETPTQAAVGLVGDSNADGLAWTFAASLMDVWPDHSFGVNYARVDAGWLLSPQYRDNEELFEVRYLWRKRQNLTFELRIRYRNELERRVDESRRRDEVDGFARFTIGFSR